MASDREDGVVVTENPSLDGLSLLVISGPSRKPLSVSQDQSILDWQELPLKWDLFGLRRFKNYECGHRGVRAFSIRIWGSTTKPRPRYKNQSCPDCCVKELSETAIRCCLCGFPIMPGDSVALYSKESVEPKDFEFTLVDSDYAMGCMRWDCCPSGGFFSGHWSGKEFVQQDWSKLK